MSENKHYELCSILTPELSQDELESFKSSIKQIIEEDGGSFGLFDVWGKRALAYNLKKFDRGFYVCVEFKGNGRLNEKLSRFLKTNESVLRHLLVKKNRREEERPRKRKWELRGKPSLSLGNEDSKGIGITEGVSTEAVEEGIIEKRETKMKSKKRRRIGEKRFIKRRFHERREAKQGPEQKVDGGEKLSE